MKSLLVWSTGAMVMAFGPFIATACVQAPAADRYSAVLRLASGNEYRAAHALTLPDCRARIADMPASDAYCEREVR